MARTNSQKADVAVIVPMFEEYEAVRKVFSVPSRAAPASLPQGGTYVVSDITTAFSLQSMRKSMRLAIACMGGMYNYRCLALTERLLQHIEPQLVFLVGSACGKIRKVSICDVFVTTDSVAYLGCGRRQDETVSPRPYTEPIDQIMKDAINRYRMVHTGSFNVWHRRCRELLIQICGASLPTEILHRAFEVKDGVIASDDVVLSWSDADQASGYWMAHVRDEAKAYDMESAGFAYGCAQRTDRPLWTVVRGISDHGYEEDKHHLAAATVAAEWLRGFIAERGEELLGRVSRAPISTTEIGVDQSDLQRLYLLLEQEEKRNFFVGKRRFIRENLGSDPELIRALNYGISRGEIKEYEVKSPKTGRRTTAIRLDRGTGL